MKKILLAFTLFIIAGAFWTKSDAHWEFGDRVTLSNITGNDTIAIEAASMSNRVNWYFTGKDQMKKEVQSITEDIIFIMKKTPYLDPFGNPTYTLKRLSDGLYITCNALTSEFIDFGAGDDSKGGGWTMSESEEYAIPWSLFPSDSLIYYPEGGGSFSDENSFAFADVYKWLRDKDPDFTHEKPQDNDNYAVINGIGYTWNYMSNSVWFDSPSLWKYQDGAHWNVYRIKYSKDILADLIDYLNFITEKGTEFEGGTDPGLYPIDLVEAFETAYMNATICSMELHTDAEYQKALDDLKAAYETVSTSVNPITTGYYYIVSAFTQFLDKQGKEMAMDIYSATQPGWSLFEELNPKQIWKITDLGDEKYSIQNYFNNLYIKGRKNNSVADVVFSTEHEVDQVFESIGEMQWLIYNVNDNTAYHPRSHSEGSGSKGDICVYNSNKLGGHSTWYLRYIDESTLAEVEKKAKQMALNEKLQEKYDEAIILYNKLACYEVDSSETAKMITDPTQLYSHAADPSEGNYANLIDNDVNTFFHTNWHDNAEPEPYSPHEMIITLNNPVKGFRFYYTERNSTSYSYRIKNVSIYACNDTVGISDKFEGWSLVKDIVGINFDEFSTEFPATINYDVDMPEEFKFIKFVVMATYPDKRARGGAYPYWNCSEFQMYPSTIVEDKSQYAYVPGMKEAADKMFQLASNAKSLIANDKSTQQSIDELAAAISDVKALFTDTIQFVKLIAECEKFIETSEIGTDVGQVTEDDVNALFEAVEKAKKVSIVDPLDKVTIDNAYTELLNAKQAFIAAMRLFEVGKWYYIISACTERMGDPGTDDAQCFGNAIYANGNNEEQIKWGLYVDGEMTGVYNPHAMWRFVPIEGTSYYAIQCLGSGYYLGEGNGFNTEVKQSFTPTPYTINYLGAGQFSILSMSNSHDQSSTLHAKGINNYIVNFPGDVSSPSSWKLQEVDTENEVEAIINTEFAMNLTDICVLPYNYTSEYFDDNVATYAVQSFEGDAETGYTKVNLYEKSEFEAGESCIIVLGSLNPEDECLPNELLIPFPTELTTEEVPTNGIWGMLHSQIAPKGTAYSTGKSYCVVEDENGVGLGAHTGAFDCRKYTGPVEEEIAYSFTFDNNGKLTGAKGAKKINKAKTSNTIYGVDGECYGDNASNLKNGVYVSGNKKFVK